MKVLWLGQGGLLFVSGKTKIMIDPYLTNSLSLLDYNLDRHMKINKKLFAVKPSVLVLTNCHPDHTDPKTIERFAKKLKKKLVILSCESVFGDIVCEKHIGDCNNILFEPGSEWTVGNVTISAVTAKTDDRSAFGVIITDNEDGKKYYVAGDTLYNRQVLSELPDDIYAAFIPINGEYGSMNLLDARRFARAIDPRFVIPVHFGMFDKLDPMELKLLNMIVPKIYRIIDFEKWSSSKPYKESLDRGFNERPEVEAQAEFEIPTDEPAINPYLYNEPEAEAEVTAETAEDSTANEPMAEASEPVTETQEQAFGDELEEDISEALDEDDVALDEELDDATLEESLEEESESSDSEVEGYSDSEPDLDDEEVEESDEISGSDTDEDSFADEDTYEDADDDAYEDAYEDADEDADKDADEDFDEEELYEDDSFDEDDNSDDTDETSSTSYTKRPFSEEDVADKIDAYIRELERFERGEDPEDE